MSKINKIESTKDSFDKSIFACALVLGTDKKNDTIELKDLKKLLLNSTISDISEVDKTLPYEIYHKTTSKIMQTAFDKVTELEKTIKEKQEKES